MHVEQVPLDAIADAVGTPVYVYSTATLTRHVAVFREGLAQLDDPLIAFAVKANPNAAVLATLAKLLDYRVVVVDSRADMVARERLPAADELICGDPAQLPALVPLTEQVNVVIVTHDHRHDADALRAVLDSPAGYIGMMGSAAKIRTIFGRLREEGVDPSALDRVHAPIGIDIGAQTPAELALCIMAEIVADGYARAEEAAAPAATQPADASAENAASGDRGSGG